MKSVPKKDLEKMAIDGYGYWLREQIPKLKRDLDWFKTDLRKLERRKQETEDAIKRCKAMLSEDEYHLSIIEEHYSHLEPEQTEEK